MPKAAKISTPQKKRRSLQSVTPPKGKRSTRPINRLPESEKQIKGDRRIRKTGS